MPRGPSRRPRGKVVQTIGLFYLFGLLFFTWGFATVRFQFFPFSLVSPVVSEVVPFFKESHKERVADILILDHQEQRSPFDFNGLKLIDPTFRDDGFLLISRYSKPHSQTVVELLDLSSNRVLHTWVPDLDAIFKLTPNHRKGINTRMAYRSQHPLLMANGDLILGSGEGPLARINSCGKPVWAIDRHFHHSIELDAAGNIVAPIVTARTEVDSGIKVRDDGFVVLSPDGNILQEYSLTEILFANGYRGLVLGVGSFEEDRYHLNDVQPLQGMKAREGLLLSIRNLSSVALFNPATGRIQWLQTGPWLNQHDIDDLANGWYSIFGNDLIRGPNRIAGDGHSEIYFYKPATGEVETPYSQVLKRINMHSGIEGRVTILANGDAFIEETTRDRLLRVSRNVVRWEYVSGVSDKTTGAVHWSRYLPRGSFSSTWLENLRCD